MSEMKISEIKIGDIWEGSSKQCPPDWDSSIKFEVEIIDSNNIAGIVVYNTIDPLKRPIGSKYERNSNIILDTSFWRRVYKRKTTCKEC